MPEKAYATGRRRLIHEYGDNVHIVSDAWSLSILARLCSPDCKPPVFHDLLTAGYWRLLEEISEQLPTKQVDIPTRMAEFEPLAAYSGIIIDPDHQVVVVDIARGGMIPSYVFHMSLLRFMNADAVRVDHVYMQRLSDPETGAVSGIEVSGSKVGGPIDNATLIIPDPMAATGSSVAYVIDKYLQRGAPRRVITCHLMCTPEYIRKITTEFPDVHIYCLRVDRGLSSEEVLASVPGSRWDEERGLTDNDYIVPGAGGLGELINNVWV